MLALGVGCVFFEVAPDVGCGVFGVTGMWLFGEGGVDQAVEFLDRIDLLIFQQPTNGLIDSGRFFEDIVFLSAPLFFQ